jgi:hypothetical protein
MSSTSPARPPLYRLVWRYVKGFLIFLVVVFHLLVFAIRNPLDLWDAEIRAWLKKTPDAENNRWDRYGDLYKKADTFTFKYTNLVGIEQRWVMFSPPVSRWAAFLAVRLEFTDGTQAVLYSDNEPDPRSFFRVGGWQQRKLEDALLWPHDNLATHDERPLWEAYARHSLRRWQAKRPGDPRTVQRIVFVRRKLFFPEPGQTASDVDTPVELDIARFDGKGVLLP